MTLAATRLIRWVMLVAALFAGCGRSPAPEAPTMTGPETVTFHVTDMGKRLALMLED